MIECVYPPRCFVEMLDSCAYGKMPGRMSTSDCVVIDEWGTLYDIPPWEKREITVNVFFLDHVVEYHLCGAFVIGEEDVGVVRLFTVAYDYFTIHCP